MLLLRKAADPVLVPRLKILYVAALIVSIIVIIMRYHDQRSEILVFTATAFLLLIADMFIVIRISEPLNKATGSLQEPFINAAALRTEWLWQIYIRAFLSVGSFISLLIGYLRSPF
jgi:hypothetical protein